MKDNQRKAVQKDSNKSEEKEIDQKGVPYVYVMPLYEIWGNLNEDIYDSDVQNKKSD